MAAKTWVTLKELGGKLYKVHHAETTYYGGSKMYSSWLERIDEQEYYGRIKGTFKENNRREDERAEDGTTGNGKLSSEERATKS